MKNTNKNFLFRLLFLISLLQFNNSFSQNNEIPANDVYSVSENLFYKIITWQSYGTSQRTSLINYLNSLNLNEDDRNSSSKLINKLLANQNPDMDKSDASTKSTDCISLVLNLNPSTQTSTEFGNDLHSNAPRGLTAITSYVYVNAGNYQNTFQKTLSNFNEFKTSKNLIIKENSSVATATFMYNYVTIDNKFFPAKCGCEKSLNVSAIYDGKFSFSNTLKDTARKASLGTTAEQAVVFSSSRQNLFNEKPVSTETHKAEHAKVIKQQSVELNDNFVTNTASLATASSKVAIAIAKLVAAAQAPGATGIPDLSNLDMGPVYNNLATVINTPIFEKKGLNESSSESFRVSFDKTFILYPNEIFSFMITPGNYVEIQGKGKYESDVKSIGSYSYVGIVPYNNSNPYCCQDKYVNWSFKSMNENFPESNYINHVKSRIALYAPWNVTVDANNGDAHGIKQCYLCGSKLESIRTDHSIRPNGNNNYTVSINWVKQEDVKHYIISLYGQSGNFIGNYTVTSNNFNTLLPKGAYKFTISTVCNNGITSITDNKSLTVALSFNEIVIEGPRNFFGKMSVEANDINENEINVKAELNITPNPSNDGIFNVLSNKKIDYVEVFDLTGKKLKEYFIKGDQEFYLDLSDEKGGKYIINVYSNNQKLFNKIIIKE